MNPSPRAHIYRLLAVMIIGIAGFIGIKMLATPAGWDHQRSYRPAAEEELKALPMRFGGNESCAAKPHGQRFQLLLRSRPIRPLVIPAGRRRQYLDAYEAGNADYHHCQKSVNVCPR